MTQENPRKMLQLMVSPSLAEAVKLAAARQLTSLSNYTRGALLSRMRAEGIDPTAAVDTPTHLRKAAGSTATAA
jgi:hypothetical protein